MSLELNASLQDIPVYQPGRPIEEVARELGLDPASVVKLASNENPLGPSPRAVAAMRRAVASSHLYPDGNAFYLKQALAAKLGVAPGNLVLGNGSNEILEFAGHALISPGAEVVVSQYCFAVYPIVTAMFGGRLVVVPARDFGHDLDAMLAAITPRTKVVFAANPNNPTGTAVSAAALLRFVDAVPAHVALVMDEAYLEFLPQPVDLVPDILAGKRPNLLLCRTFSKIHGLAALRLGYGIGQPALITALEKIRQPFNTNAIAQAGALAALADPAHAERTRKNNLRGLRFYERTFKRLKLPWVPSAANFILVRVGDGQRVFLDLQRQGVIVRPMGGYGLGEWIRISIGKPAENRRCADALAAALAKQP